MLWLCTASDLYHTREGEGGAGAVSSGAGSACILLAFMLTCFSCCACVRCLLRTKMHMGFLLREYCCPLATWVVSKKGSHVARPQGEKVPTRGFLAKKEGVWRELSRTGADLWIFGEKGSCVAQPLCHFSPLSEKGRWVVQPQRGKVPTCGFSAKKETVWHDLKICQIFFISLCTSTD